jgi:putative FmdB family regulatory protein
MIYEYRCGECENVNEFHMRMSDPHPTICPSCNKQNTLERIISRTAFALKGSGWYTTDYKRSSSPSGSAASTSAEKSSEIKASEQAATGAGANATPKAETK